MLRPEKTNRRSDANRLSSLLRYLQEPQTTRELAVVLKCSLSTVRRMLTRLIAQGQVRSDKAQVPWHYVMTSATEPLTADEWVDDVRAQQLLQIEQPAFEALIASGQLRAFETAAGRYFAVQQVFQLRRRRQRSSTERLPWVR
jgi:hypothetical protein